MLGPNLQWQCFYISTALCWSDFFFLSVSFYPNKANWTHVYRCLRKMSISVNNDHQVRYNNTELMPGYFSLVAGRSSWEGPLFLGRRSGAVPGRGAERSRRGSLGGPIFRRIFVSLPSKGDDAPWITRGSIFPRLHFFLIRTWRSKKKVKKYVQCIFFCVVIRAEEIMAP